jgi:hypothetical protein
MLVLYSLTGEKSTGAELIFSQAPCRNTASLKRKNACLGIISAAGMNIRKKAKKITAIFIK